MKNEYDLAFSFASEDREYVKLVKEECEILGLKVYYDRDRTVEQWGKNILKEQRKVYGYNTKYFVPFISSQYFEKTIPTDEFQSAMLTGAEKEGYILAVIIGKAKIPPEYLHPLMQYLCADNFTPKQLAKALSKKVTAHINPPKDINKIFSEETDLPLPKLIPPNFNTFKEAEDTLQYLTNQFAKNLLKIESMGFGTYSSMKYDNLKSE
jgi:hypothetical protein